jgi:hypothetical protein
MALKIVILVTQNILVSSISSAYMLILSAQASWRHCNKGCGCQEVVFHWCRKLLIRPTAGRIFWKDGFPTLEKNCVCIWGQLPCTCFYYYGSKPQHAELWFNWMHWGSVEPQKQSMGTATPYIAVQICCCYTVHLQHNKWRLQYAGVHCYWQIASYWYQSNVISCIWVYYSGELKQSRGTSTSAWRSTQMWARESESERLWSERKRLWARPGSWTQNQLQRRRACIADQRRAQVLARERTRARSQERSDLWTWWQFRKLLTYYYGFLFALAHLQVGHFLDHAPMRPLACPITSSTLSPSAALIPLAPPPTTPLCHSAQS